MSRPYGGWNTGGSRNSPYLGYTVTQKGEHGSKKYSKGISRKHPNGLYNFGNRCYFNSVLQSLSYTPAFMQELLDDTNKGQLGQSFIEIALELRDSERQLVNPEDVTKCFTTKVPRFANSEQHDSHECLRHFLEELRKEERESKSSSPSNSQLTVVDKIFGGHLVTVYVCEDCGKHYHLFEPCLDISLPVFFEGENRKDENQTGGQIYGQNPDQKRRKDVQSKHGYSEPMCNVGCCTLSSYDSEMSQISAGVRSCDSVKDSEMKSKTATGKSKTQKNCFDRNKAGYIKAIETLMSRLSPIPNDTSAGELNRSRFSRSISLSDCFKHFSRVEQISEEYLCEDCLREAMDKGRASEDNLKLTSATKQTLIFNPPAILTIHFKRFELLPGRSKKRSDMVEYPEDLDIAPYCSSQCLRNDPPRNNIWYSLYAIIVHSGSLEFGHYVAYVREKSENIEQVKNFLQNEYFNHNVTSEELIMMMQKKAQPKRKEREDSNWYLINDSNVRKAGIDEVLTQEAYLLFYERIP